MNKNYLYPGFIDEVKGCLNKGSGSGGGGEPVDAYTKTQTDNLLLNKVDKEDGKGLFSGSYNDLSDTPTIPTKTSQLDNDSNFTTNESVDEINNNLEAHTGNKQNPHGVTKSQIGLDNVENKSSATIRGELTSSNVTTALGYTPLDSAKKGSANGVAELGSDGKVLSSQLPSYVDDVLEYSSKSSFPSKGEAGKIYVDTSTNLTYRWSGSAYVEISQSLALGETSSTAYRGDKGKIAYEHSQSTHARTDATKVEKSSTNGNIKINGTETTVYEHPSGTNPHGTTKSDVGLGNVGNFKAVSTVASQGLSDTEKSNARTNIGAGTSSLTLGETSSTAYRGDRGKTAYEHSQKTSGNPHGVTKSDVGLGNVDNTADKDKVVNSLIDSSGATVVGGKTGTLTYYSTEGAVSTTKDIACLEESPSSGGYSLHRMPLSKLKSRLSVDKVDNTADLDKPISTATQTALDEINSNLATNVLISKYPNTKTVNNVVFAKVSDGKYTVNGTNSASWGAQVRCDTFKALANVEYIVNVNGDSSDCYIGVDAEDTSLGRKTDGSVIKFDSDTTVSVYMAVKASATVSSTLTFSVTTKNVGGESDKIKYGIADINARLTDNACKNLIDYRSFTFSNNASGTSHSIDSDGVITITRVADANSGIYTYDSSLLNKLKGHTVTISLDVKVSTEMNIRMFLNANVTISEFLSKKCGTDWQRISFTANIPSDITYLGIVIYGNAIAGTMYIKDIMISYADISDTTYEKYYPTNKELDENKADVSYVDAIEIGGTNLLINTATFEGYENFLNITSEQFLGHDVWEYTLPSTLTSFRTILGKPNVVVETDEYYTLSFYAKGTGHINSYFYRASGSLVESGYNNIGSTTRAGDGAIGIDLTDEWKKYITTWKVHKSSTLSLNTKEVFAGILIARFEKGQVAGNNISICGVKFEKGNKATDWSPAPEDITNEIQKLSDRISALENK